MQTGQTRSGFRHLLVLGVMLSAHFLAVGTPVWHVAAHALGGEHTEHHAEHFDGPSVGHHEEIHPPQLHESGVATASAPLLVFFVPARRWSIDTPPTQSVVPIRHRSVLRSRAPPPGDPARAPPLV